MATKEQFDAAVQRQLGSAMYRALVASGYSRPDFCREIAQRAFTRSLHGVATRKEDLDLIRAVADRLWNGDGCTALEG